MPWEKNAKAWATLISALLSTAAPLSRAAADDVGSVSAVNQVTTGIAPGLPSRMLTIGSGVVFNETIKTSPDGSAQLTFLDRSTLNVGRNSNLVIDQFVYNPATATGSMAVTLTTGALRFVGGQISHTAGVSISTPVAVAAIRGGSATIAYAAKEAGKTCAGGLFINQLGTLTLKNKVDQITIDRQGYGVCATSDNQPFPTPTLIPDAILAAFLASAGSTGGQHGGATTLPTDQLVSRGGLEFPRLDPPGNSPGTNPFDIISIINAGNGASQSTAQNGQVPGGYGD